MQDRSVTLSVIADHHPVASPAPRAVSAAGFGSLSLLSRRLPTDDAPGLGSCDLPSSLLEAQSAGLGLRLCLAGGRACTGTPSSTASSPAIARASPVASPMRASTVVSPPART